MDRLFSNGPAKDFVINPFTRLIEGASQLCLAAPYFTEAEPLVEAARRGKRVQLLVGLNCSTHPVALAKVHDVPGLAVRYLTHRFHAKIYLFDDQGLIGSSNLTDGGLRANREAVLCLDRPDDSSFIEEMRALFQELWDSAQVLTDEKLQLFKQAHEAARKQAVDLDARIEAAVGRAEPANIHVASLARSRQRLFEETLRRQVYEEYRPAFAEVADLLERHRLRRADLASVGLANEANRFLNWVRLTRVRGDDVWQAAALRPRDERERYMLPLAEAWAIAADPKIPSDYIERLGRAEITFESSSAIEGATKEGLTSGLMSIHAFGEQYRFVKGGWTEVAGEFWRANRGDVARVKASLDGFLHGRGDFIARLHDMLYHPAKKLKMFGYFCALELYGTVKPAECPPMNGRMAKALRFLGFDVRTS